LHSDDSIGSIEAGKKADMILIDLRKPHLTPIGKRVVSHLVWSAYASDVDSVIIDGKLVMEHRHLKTLDESDIVDKANKLSEGILKRLELKKNQSGLGSSEVDGRGHIQDRRIDHRQRRCRPTGCN